jgi:Kef-type K+ transport system membrane component KefB
VTVALDVLAIFLFAIVLSASEVLISGGQSFSLSFLLTIAAEVGASAVLGLLVGKGIALYLARVRRELTIFTLATAFLITRVSHALAHVLESGLGVRFHLEPMLICLAAGFIVQNFSRSGDSFLRVIDRSALPIYTLFFTMSGASLRILALRDTWHWALLLVGIRGFFLYAAAVFGGRLAGDPKRFHHASGLSFFTQAGVSLGLIKVLIETFPTFGPSYATLLVATITINQVIGPVGLKYALSSAGETRESRLAAARDSRATAE